VGVICCGAAVTAQITRPEYELKAAVVSKFPEFTEWPEDLLNNRRTIDLCVVQPNPFGQVLNDLVAGEILRGHALVARDVSDPRNMASCQLLFVPSRSSTDLEEVLASVKNLPVLTIGESTDFLDRGGIVSVRVVEGRVRFEVNLDAANRAGVRLSSQLLRLAQRVRGGSG
jgi:hypothetical protein